MSFLHFEAHKFYRNILFYDFVTLEVCDDDAKNDGIQGEEGVIDIGGITPMNDNKLSMDDVGGSNELKSSNVPMERTLAHLHDMIQIIEKCKQKKGHIL
jgi:hypothetical protein